MANIFIFTAADPKAKQNLEVSIKNSIPKVKVFQSFIEDKHQELERIYQVSNGFYAWGATPPKPGKRGRNKNTWEQMQQGDFVLCVFGKTCHFIAQIIAPFDNIELAKRVWGTTEDGRTWQYLYFLTEPKGINVPLDTLDGYLAKIYQGFSRVGEDNVDRIIEQFGSLNEFMQSRFSYTNYSHTSDNEHDELELNDNKLSYQPGNNEGHEEGDQKYRLSKTYERSRKNRADAIKIHGLSCKICGFHFEKVYGKLGKSFIEIHHIYQLCNFPVSTNVDPKTDLIPICSNCHRMLHRNRKKQLTPEELRQIYKSYNN